MAITTKLADYRWIAGQLNKLKIINPDGSVSFRSRDAALAYDDLVMLIETHHQFPADIPDVERRRILADAIRSTVKAGELSDYSLKANVLKAIGLFGSRPQTEFVFVTSLTIKHHRALGSFKFDACDFAFSAPLPKSFARQNPERFRVIHPLPDLVPGSTAVRVSVSARSDFEAYHKAVESLDFLRGIWNFRVNRGILSRWSSGPVKPVNRIRLGPVHTLHLPNGQEVSPLFWYELLSPSEATIESVHGWNRIKDEAKRISEIIEKSNYRDFLKNMFVRYVRSLDSSDHEASFLKLWSLLEYLTAVEDKADYDEIIKRALFLSHNDDYDNRMLQHLRIRRNSTVHRGEASSQVETFIFQLKRYIEALMLFHLQFGYRFSSPEKLGELLSKPRDLEVLKKRIAEIEADAELHRLALQVRTPPSESENTSQEASTG